MSLCAVLRARATLGLSGKAACFTSRRLLCHWRSAGRPAALEASSQQGGGQQPWQQRQQQRRRDLAASAAPSPPAPSAAQHSHVQPPSQHQQQHGGHHGAIEIVVGPMFAGKTTELLRRVAEYEAAGLSVAVVKSNKDDRYCSAHVVTHNGLKRPCFAVPSLAAFKQAAGPAYGSFHVIAVDEAQFFPDLRDFSTHAADHEQKRLILAGLDGDFRRQRFGQVLDLLPLADSVTKLTAHCKFCAQEERRTSAVFSLRISADSRQELVGGADVYAPVCRRHYVELSAVRQPQQQEQAQQEQERAGLEEDSSGSDAEQAA